MNQKEENKKPKRTISFEDKYKLYESTVQCVENDIEFVDNEYKKVRGKPALVLREDFCGTGKLACTWAATGKDRIAIGLDLDPEPIEFGKKYHFAPLSEDAKSRVTYHLQNVLESDNHRADVVVAFNFSYFIFKERQVLLKYFKAVKKSLNKDGMFFIDLFGGPEAQTVMEEVTKYDNYKYYWDCDKFNPLTNECLFKIHFKKKGEKKLKDVFVYDWRLWSLPELRDIMIEAGFKEVHSYWEGEDEDGDGNGEFYRSNDEENCESWVTYLVGMV